MLTECRQMINRGNTLLDSRENNEDLAAWVNAAYHFAVKIGQNFDNRDQEDNG